MSFSKKAGPFYPWRRTSRSDHGHKPGVFNEAVEAGELQMELSPILMGF
jgi:hypothetical protein